METEYIFKSNKTDDEISILLDCEETNTDLRDELAYDLFVDRKAEEIKDEFYIDEVYGEK